jgi:hypothetical protein
MMIRPRESAQREAADLRYRKMAYTGFSHILGVQARAHLSINVIVANGDRVDVALVSGLIDFRRLNESARVPIARTGFADPRGASHAPRGRGPLSPAPEGIDLPLLAEFSTRVEGLEGVDLGNGFLEVILGPGPTGNLSRGTVLMGELMRSAGSRYGEPDDRTANLNAHVRVPCETLIHDVYLRREEFDAPDPGALVFSEPSILNRALPQDGLPGRLEIDASVAPMGRGAVCGGTPVYEAYTPMARRVFEHLGVDGSEFELYRLELRYPPVYSLVNIRLDLPLERNEA